MYSSLVQPHMSMPLLLFSTSAPNMSCSIQNLTPGRKDEEKQVKIGEYTCIHSWTIRGYIAVEWYKTSSKNLGANEEKWWWPSIREAFLSQFSKKGIAISKKNMAFHTIATVKFGIKNFLNVCPAWWKRENDTSPCIFWSYTKSCKHTP